MYCTLVLTIFTVAPQTTLNPGTLAKLTSPPYVQLNPSLANTHLTLVKPQQTMQYHNGEESIDFSNVATNSSVCMQQLDAVRYLKLIAGEQENTDKACVGIYIKLRFITRV